MNQTSEIDVRISLLIKDISDYTAQTRSGVMIDLGNLPGQIMELQGMVQNSPRDLRLQLTSQMAKLLEMLDKLSQEIQIHHDDLSRDIDRLDIATGKE